MKETKEQAGYTPKAAKHSERCELCKYFLPEKKKCQKVEGFIAPQAWCKRFKPK